MTLGKSGRRAIGRGVVPWKRRPRDTGAIRKLPSGRYQARFRGTDGVMRPASVTFQTREDAAAWLAAELRATELGIWSPPEEKVKVGPTEK